MTAVTVRTAVQRRHRPGAVTWLPVVLALATVGTQIAYPLVDGTSRDQLTIAIVCVFAAFSMVHAAVHRGMVAAAGLLVVAGGVGFTAEVVGVRTGLPFGDYVYGDGLGVEAFDVPLVVALAWTMMAYPALLVGRRLVRDPARAAIVGAVALASWDLFLDPMMVDADHWRWTDVTHTLPGIEDVPVSNFAGWLLVSLVVVALLDRVVPRQHAPTVAPLAIYLWVYFSSVLANAVFFDRPGVAVVGGVVMGVVALPLALSLVRR